MPYFYATAGRQIDVCTNRLQQAFSRLPEFKALSQIMKISPCCYVLAATLLLCGCVGLGEGAMSSPLVLQATPGGFVATQRAGIDRLANNPTWESVRRQDLAAAAGKAGYCPKGIASIERQAAAVRNLEIGTSQDLTYFGRCVPDTAPAAAQTKLL